MTPKERILNNIKGLPADRTSWCPFLAYYWSYLPKEVREKGEVAYLQSLNADPLLRGCMPLSKPIYHNCDIRETINGNLKEIVYETPVGTIRLEYTYSPDGDTWFLTTHPVTEEEDFKVLQYIYEHIELEEDIQRFEQWSKEVGDSALMIPTVGVTSKTCFQSMVEHWVGTVDLTYALMDFPEVVEECLAVMREKDLETVRIACKSSAEGFIFWEDSSTTNISPSMFEEYTLPIIKEWGNEIHRNGKLLIHHACGHLRHLLPIISTSGIDALESISPPPTGNIELQDIRRNLNPEIALIGGIEPTRLLNMPMDELEAHVREILTFMKGYKYVLGNSDSCPPFVDEEKFRMISRLVREMA